MNIRVKIMLVVVAILIGFNIWRWWPEPDTATKDASATRRVEPDLFDLRLAGHESADEQTSKIKRDLFSPVASQETVAQQKQPEPEKTQETAQTASRHQQILKKLEEFKLVGILLQGGVKRAFLTRDETNFTVKQGDRIDDSYIVDDVTLTSVTLSEAKSRISKKIELE